jgi:hypothetical protein
VRADDDLGVDAASVVLADGGDRLVVHRDQVPIDSPCVVAGVGGWAQRLSQHWHEVMDDAVHGGLAGVEQCGQRPGGQVGAQVDQDEQ